MYSERIFSFDSKSQFYTKYLSRSQWPWISIDTFYEKYSRALFSRGFLLVSGKPTLSSVLFRSMDCYANDGGMRNLSIQILFFLAVGYRDLCWDSTEGKAPWMIQIIMERLFLYCQNLKIQDFCSYTRLWNLLHGKDSFAWSLERTFRKSPMQHIKFVLTSKSKFVIKTILILLPNTLSLRYFWLGTSFSHLNHFYFPWKVVLKQ